MSALHRVQCHSVASNGTWIVPVFVLVRSDIVISFSRHVKLYATAHTWKLSIFTAGSPPKQRKESNSCLPAVRITSFGIHPWLSSLLGKRTISPAVDLDDKVKLNVNRVGIYLWVMAFPLIACAQKVRVGYDKGTDFLKFKTYSWGEPTMPVTRPLVYAGIVGLIDMELKAKGLARAERDSDLVLIPAGGMEYGLNQAASAPILPTYGSQPVIDSTNWMGPGGPSNLMAPYVPEGTFVLTVIDRVSNKMIWTGTVKEKLDIENKTKSLQRIDKAIVKLLKQFPPKKK